jgi:CRP/FNR family transcriptional regulator, cyclic AMP receptor protein
MRIDVAEMELRRERAELLDGELELRRGRNGVTAVPIDSWADSEETPHESLEVRVSLHPFLAGMSHHHLVLLTDCAAATHFKRGDVILEQGLLADRFYLIESGRVRLESSGLDHERVIVETIGDGDLLGWSWMFPPYVWHFTARAMQPADALVFSGNVLREICERDHSLGYELFKRMSAVMLKRLQSARAKMLPVALRSAG